MDRPSSTQAKDDDITLRVDPSARPSRDNVYSRALQEQERRRQVVAGRRRGGGTSVASFDGPPQWSQDGPRQRVIGSATSGAPSGASSRSGSGSTTGGRRTADMLMALPPRPKEGEERHVGWDDVKPFEPPTNGPAGSDGFISRSDHAEPRSSKNVNVPVYEWFTCNIANLRCGPAAAAPFVRFTGFFGGPNAERDARRHVECEGKHRALGQLGIVSYVFKARHIVVAGIDPERCTSKEVADRKKKVVLEAVYDWAAERQKQFDENVRAHQHGKVGLASRHKREVKRKQESLRKAHPVPEEEAAKRKAAADAFVEIMKVKEAEAKENGEEAAYDLASGPPPYPMDLEIRGQKFVVVTVVPDESVRLDDEGSSSIDATKWQDAEGCGFEPLFIAQTCAPDEDKADLYSRDGVWQKFLDAENLTAPMYEWLPLNEIDDPRIQNHWFDAEQDLVMKRQQQDVLEAQKFAELCHNMGKKMPVIDLTDPEGKGMIPAMRKGVLEGEELEQAIKDQEDAKAKEDALMTAPIEELRKMDVSDPRKNRTFIRADGTAEGAKGPKEPREI